MSTAWNTRCLLPGTHIVTAWNAHCVMPDTRIVYSLARTSCYAFWTMPCDSLQQHGQSLCLQRDATRVKEVDMDVILHVGSKYALQV